MLEPCPREWGDGAGGVGGAAGQVTGPAVAQAERRDGVVKVGRVQGVVRRVDHGVVGADRVAGQPADRSAPRLHGGVAGAGVKHRPPVLGRLCPDGGHVHRVGGRGQGHIDRDCPNIDRRRGVVGQPARSVALQVALSSIETVVPAPLAMYKVWLAESARAVIGPAPTGTCGGVCPQPEVTVALQVAPLTTESVLAPPLATYTVSVLTSIAIPVGVSLAVPFPTVMVGQGPWQRDTSWALQCRASITETVSPPAFGPL